MHIGNYLQQLIREKRYPVADVAKMVNKSDTSVRKDFEKKEMHMAALEAYAKVLDVNIYEILSTVWKAAHDPQNPKKYSVEEMIERTLSEGPQEALAPPQKVTPPEDRITVALDISGEKKNAIMKILLEK